MIYLFYIFLLSIPLGYRVILYQWTLGFDEYETAFLYANDFLMLLFLSTYFLSLSKKNNFISKIILRKNSGQENKNLQFTIYNLHLIFKSQFSIKAYKAISTKSQFFRSLMSQILKPLCFEDIGLRNIALSSFLFFSFITIFWATFPLLALYNFIRLLLLVFVALTISALLKAKSLKLEVIFGILASLAIVESLIGFLQFLFQHSLGLWWLGESLVGERIIGSAKIIVEGGAVLRAYGTFPHPNVLGAFLVLGLMSLCYFWLRRPSERKMWSGWSTLKSDMVFGLGLYVVLVGLTLTFSRSTWAIAILATTILIIYNLFINRKYIIQTVRLTFLLLAISYILFNSYSVFIFPRAQLSVNEPAVTYRISYDKLGLELIKNNPLGVGLGNQVIYSVKNNIYKESGMNKVWEWQPIHNMYLLIGAETGILGLVSFLLLVLSLFVKPKIQKLNYKQNINLKKTNWKLGGLLDLNFKYLFRFSDLDIRVFMPKLMLLSLMFFGMTDHFLWTIEPGRLMFWIVLAMNFAQE
ncbi:MAG: O-antigen ligase family protein [bacterium]|nr:O-antigen ligase family protein [bacterium]